MKKLLTILLFSFGVAHGQLPAFIGFSSHPPAAGAFSPILQADAESVELESPWDLMCDASGSLTRSTDEAFAGSYSYKFVVNPPPSSECAGGRRAELNLFSETTTTLGYDGFDRWIRFRFKLDAGWTYQDLSPTITNIITQFHDNPQSGEYPYKSALEIHLLDDKFTFAIRAASSEDQSDLTEYLADYSLANFMNGSNPTIAVDTWYDVKVHVRFTQGKTTTDGLVRMWINGTLVGSYDGSIGFDHDWSPFWKIGNYASYMNENNLSWSTGFFYEVTQTTYMDNIFYGDDEADLTP